MNPVRRVGSVFVIVGLLFVLAAPAVSNSRTAPDSDPTLLGEEASQDQAEDAQTNGGDSVGKPAPVETKRDVKATCPSGQARVDQGNHKGQCVATPGEGTEAVQRGATKGTADELAAQTTLKMVVVQIVQRSCEVRNGVSETNVTFSFRHNGLNTTGKIEMTINGPTGVIVISEKTEFELPDGVYRWTARSIDAQYEIEGPTSGELVVLSCAAGSTTTTTSTTTTVPVTTTTTVPVSATTVTSPTTTSTTSSSTTTTTATTTSTTAPPTTSTTVPPDECEPPDCLPYTGPADEYWPMAVFGTVLMVCGMAALAFSRLIEERQERSAALA